MFCVEDFSFFFQKFKDLCRNAIFFPQNLVVLVFECFQFDCFSLSILKILRKLVHTCLWPKWCSLHPYCWILSKKKAKVRGCELPFGASYAPSFLLLQFEFVIGLLLVLCEYVAAFVSWAGRDPFGMVVDVLICTYRLFGEGWKCRRDFGQLREHLVLLNYFVASFNKQNKPITKSNECRSIVFSLFLYRFLPVRLAHFLKGVELVKMLWLKINSTQNLWYWCDCVETDRFHDELTVREKTNERLLMSFEMKQNYFLRAFSFLLLSLSAICKVNKFEWKFLFAFFDITASNWLYCVCVVFCSMCDTCDISRWWSLKKKTLSLYTNAKLFGIWTGEQYRWMRCVVVASFSVSF